MKQARSRGADCTPANLQENLDKFFEFTRFVRPVGQVIVQLTDDVDGGADKAGNSGESGVEGGGVDDYGNAKGKDEDERTARDQVIVQPTDGVDGGADKAGNSGEDGGEDEDEEFKTLADKFVSSDNRDLAESYMEWIRLQVDRFQAPRKKMSFMMRTRTPRVDLTLLAVRRPEPNLLVRYWSHGVIQSGTFVPSLRESNLRESYVY